MKSQNLKNNFACQIGAEGPPLSKSELSREGGEGGGTGAEGPQLAQRACPPRRGLEK